MKINKNFKLLKIAMCLALVCGTVSTQYGYSMEDMPENEQQPGRERFGMKKILNNQYLNKAFKNKEIKGNGFSTYKETYQFSYDINNELYLLANPSENQLKQAALDYEKKC